jgi:hypothetical protein
MAIARGQDAGSDGMYTMLKEKGNGNREKCLMDALVMVIYYKVKDGIMCVCSSIIHLQLIFTQVIYIQGKVVPVLN